MLPPSVLLIDFFPSVQVFEANSVTPLLSSLALTTPSLLYFKMRTWKSVVPLTILGLGSGLVAALPTEDNLLKMMSSGSIDEGCPFANLRDNAQDDLDKRAGSIRGPVDSMLPECFCSCVYVRLTSITVTGEHAFRPPNFEKGDERGPCPGLNALANHGYIPHNGVVSVSYLRVCTSEYIR